MADDSLTPRETYTDLRDAYNVALGELNALRDTLDQRKADKDAPPEEIEDLTAEFNGKFAEVKERLEKLESKEARDRAVAEFKPVKTEKDQSLRVREPDIYQRGGRSFFKDAYAAQVQNDPAASDRIEKHQRFEIEKRAVTSSLFTGGLIPPQYLRDLYAKASRNGRVFADQVNNKELPPEGMSLVVPRITTATAAGFQSSENTALTTQDPVETDLSVNVRTLGAYLPVSRQSIERGAYTDEILFEDLIARYWAQLDASAINGSGASGTFLGLIGTSGIVSVTASTITAAGVYPKIADAAQQVSTNMGGIGYLPDKIFMHPRRWAMFAASLDSQNRPLITPTPVAVNVMGTVESGSGGGTAGGYGFTGQALQGLPVYLDANIPTNLGTNTNEDRIILVCSPVVHLWERPGDPVTVSFEQQAGTSLQVQLVVFGYAAFTAGRYPGASAIITGLTPPTF